MSEPTKRSNALYYHKQALKYGDKDLAKEYLDEYYSPGGKASGLQQSLKNANPLVTVPTALRSKFLASLDEADKQAWEKGVKWWRETYMGSKKQ